MSKIQLSIVIVVHNMPRQAINTIYSLSPQHQKNIAAESYELVIVENKSKHIIHQESLDKIQGNIQYILRDEKSQSPAGAINEGIRKSRGEYVGIIIDGARMATPRCLEFMLMAFRAHKNSFVSVPSYNIGPQPHQFNTAEKYGMDYEASLLAKCRWKENGYRLFDISTIGDANHVGFFNPPLESNFYATTKENLELIGGADTRFDLPGGGSLNLHMYRKLGLLPGIKYFLLHGEGTFHQFHGGITTSSQADREAVLESHRKQLHSFWGGGFQSLRREPVLLGCATSHSLRFLKYSSKRNIIRSQRMLDMGNLLWEDDTQSAEQNP